MERETPISIRDICRADVPDILRINHGAFPAVSYLDAKAAESLIAIASVAWVAVDGEHIAGYLIAFVAAAPYHGEEFLWFRQRGKDFVYIDQIAMASAFRRAGIGRLLYSKLAVWSGRNHCRAVTCEVNLDPPNPGSLAFHTRCGFLEVGRMLTSDGRHVVLLRRGM